MKIKIIMAFAFASFLGQSCQKAEFGDAVILVSGTEVDPIVRFTVEDTPSEFAVVASTSHRAEQNIDVEFELDSQAVENYNAANNTTYFMVPDGTVEVSNLSATISAGSSTSTPVAVRVISTAPLIDGRSYLIPVTIKNVSSNAVSVLESSRTIFLRIARVINFAAVSMNGSTGATTGSPGGNNDPNQRGKFNGIALFDPQNPEMLPNFTVEFKNLIYAFRGGSGNTNPQPIQTLINFTNQWEETSIGFRYGELGNPNNSLQLIGSLGGAFSYGFNENQWYTISFVYDGSVGRVFVDGVQTAEVSGSMVMEFSRMQFGQCWGGYHSRQYVNGRMSEVRVWNRPLTTAEIRLNLCGADPNSEGLLAYWKLNEGSGHMFYNSSPEGSRYDMDWSAAYWDPSGSGNDNLVLADKSHNVVWTNDELNRCAQ